MAARRSPPPRASAPHARAVISAVAVSVAAAVAVAGAGGGAARTTPPVAARPFVFDAPVLMGEGKPSAPVKEHFWFPEDGAFLGKGEGASSAAVVANMRFTMDGSPSPPGLPHTTATVVSWDGGSTFSPAWFDHPVLGTPSAPGPNGTLIVPGTSCVRSADNRSFACARQIYSVCANASSPGGWSVCSRASAAGTVNYTGWPFPVARFTYCSKVVATTSGGLVQLRAYSHKVNEVGGPDENLAAFGSADGATWRFLAVVASRSPVYSAKQWEGPGENDLTVLADGRLLAVFRVESCQPYRKAYSSDGGATWTKPEAMPFGSARPKLRTLSDGRVLLSGGRPGLFLWVGDAGGEAWDPINLAALHNNLTGAAHEDWWFSNDFITSAARGVWVQGSTSYMSLLDLGGGAYIVQYDRLANGWKEPPGPWGDRDRAFSLSFRLAPSAAPVPAS